MCKVVKKPMYRERLFGPWALVESFRVRLGMDDLEGEQRVCIDKPETMLAEAASY